MAQTRVKKVTILNLNLEREKVPFDPSPCGQCGMALDHPRAYHPFAACLMMKASGNGNTVQANLEAVVEHAQKQVAK